MNPLIFYRIWSLGILTLLKLVCILTLKLDRRDSSVWETSASLYPSSQPPESEKKKKKTLNLIQNSVLLIPFYHYNHSSFVYFVFIYESVAYYMFTCDTYHGDKVEEVHAWLVGFGVGQFE